MLTLALFSACLFAAAAAQDATCTEANNGYCYRRTAGIANVSEGFSLLLAFVAFYARTVIQNLLKAFELVHTLALSRR